MLKSIYKKDTEKRYSLSPTSKGDTSSPSKKWRDMYNKTPGECKWPTTRLGIKVEDCKFNIEKLDEVLVGKGKVSIITIPKGTFLYHKTVIYPGGAKWFDKQYPMDVTKGLVWFTSTQEHSGMIVGTHLLRYKLEKDLILVYEQSLSSKYGDNIRGFEYIPVLYGVMQKMYSTESLKEISDNIDGYAGCNECEIALTNDAIKKKLCMKPKLLQETSLSYFD